MIPNIIKIDKNIPLPRPNLYGRQRPSKFDFITELDVGDSFEVNGNTPDLKPSSVAHSCYSVAGKVRKKGGIHRNFRVACRTLEGTTLKPLKVRVWRIQ